MNNQNKNFPNFISPAELIKLGVRNLSDPNINLDKILSYLIARDRSDVLSRMLNHGLDPYIELQMWGYKQSLTDFCLDCDAKKCIKKLIDVFDLDAIEPSRTALTAMLRNHNRAQYFQFFVEKGLNSTLIHSEDRCEMSPFIICIYAEEQSERETNERASLLLPVSNKIIQYFNAPSDLDLFQKSIDKNIDKMIEAEGTTEALYLIKRKVEILIEKQSLDHTLEKMVGSDKQIHKI